MILLLRSLVVLFFILKSNVKSNTRDLSVFNYHLSTGIPEAARLMAAEAKTLARGGINQIIGGRTIDVSQVPYQTGLVIKVRYLLTSVCGGSLISATRVVTAAHCSFDGFSRAQGVTVVLGSSHIFTGGVRIDSDGIIVHNDWNPRTMENDIAIVFISPVVFSDVIQPISLPSDDELKQNFVGWTALASGYGLTKDENIIYRNQELSSVQLSIITNAQCQAVFGDIVRPTNICSNGTDVRGTCNGDSGGPLVVDSNGRRILIGITSFGARAGCEKGYPDAYTRITSYVSWIVTF